MPIDSEVPPRCGRCGEITPPDELIRISGVDVCGNCKPTVVQEVREGIAPEVIAGGEEIAFGSILSEGWGIYTRHFLPIALLVVLTALPLAIVDEMLFPLGDEFSWREFGRSIRFSTLTQSLFGIFSTLCVVIVVARHRDGEGVGFGATLLAGLKRWPSGAFVDLLATIIVGLLFLLLIAPGVIFMAFYAFAIPAAALCGRNGTGALRMSRELVRGRWFQVAGYHLGFFGIALVPVIATGIASAFMPELFALTVGINVLDSVSMAFVTVCSTVYFLRLIGQATT